MPLTDSENGSNHLTTISFKDIFIMSIDRIFYTISRSLSGGSVFSYYLL